MLGGGIADWSSLTLRVGMCRVVLAYASVGMCRVVLAYASVGMCRVVLAYASVGMCGAVLAYASGWDVQGCPCLRFGLG